MFQDTSNEAFLAVLKGLRPYQREVMNLLANGYELTADEIAERTDRTVLFTRPAVSGLVKSQLLADTGRRRVNASGKSAIVWRIKK